MSNTPNKRITANISSNHNKNEQFAQAKKFPTFV